MYFFAGLVGYFSDEVHIKRFSFRCNVMRYFGFVKEMCVFPLLKCMIFIFLSNEVLTEGYAKLIGYYR